MNVGGAETEFAGSGFEDNAVWRVKFLELFGDGLSSVRRGVVDDYKFPVERARYLFSYYCMWLKGMGAVTFR